MKEIDRDRDRDRTNIIHYQKKKTLFTVQQCACTYH